MRFFRFAAITVLLLACVVLGTACAGAKGADGVGIEGIVDNGDGTVTFMLTDGSNHTSDIVTGPQAHRGYRASKGFKAPRVILQRQVYRAYREHRDSRVILVTKVCRAFRVNPARA